MLGEIGHPEGEDGHCANIGISILEVVIPCTCGCLFHSIGNYFGLARRRA